MNQKEMLLSESEADILETLERFGVKPPDAGGTTKEEKAELLIRSIDQCPPEEFRAFLDMDTVLWLRKAFKRNTEDAVLSANSLKGSRLGKCSFTFLRKCGLADWDGRAGVRVSALVRKKLAGYSKEEKMEQESADRCVLIGLGLADYSGIVLPDQLHDSLYARPEKPFALHHVSILDNCVDIVMLSACRRFGMTTEWGGASPGQFRHPLAQDSFPSRMDWAQIRPKVVPWQHAIFRGLVGYVPEVKEYAELAEYLCSAEGRWGLIFDPDVGEKGFAELKNYCLSHSPRKSRRARMLLHILKKVTTDVMMSHDPSENVRILKHFPLEDGQEEEKRDELIEALLDHLPVWSLRGHTRAEERAGSIPIWGRLPGKAGTSLPRGLCPCGSGKLYAICHGRYQ